jgi:hypothetical protein
MEDDFDIFANGGFFLDDGTPVNPDLVPKPALCLMCKFDDSSDSEDDILCILNRIDQMNNSEEFKCASYEKKFLME